MLRIDLHSGGMCDRPVGKPRGKDTSLGQLNGKTDTAATAREESRCAGLRLRRGLTPLWRLQRNPKVHVSTGEETSGSAWTPDVVLGPGTDWRGIPRGPSQLAWRLAFPEATQAGP